MVIGEYYVVVVWLGWIGGVKVQVVGVECGGDFGYVQWYVLMVFSGVYDGVDGKKVDGMCQWLQGMWGYDSKMYLFGRIG